MLVTRGVLVGMLWKKFLKISVTTVLALGLLGVVVTTGLYVYVAPRLPDLDALRDTQYQVPLRVFTADNRLIAEFGEKRRTPLEYTEMPPLLIKAVLGAEDDRFFEHPGVDYQGILRAVGKLVLTGQKVEGGSTITMQVARNFFLSREKTFLRKFSEVLLAFKIEDELSKEEILSLYLNKIYFGNRAYGVGAAAHVYYGKQIKDLSLAQIAMIAGLPKAPSRYNPIVNPKRALLRRDYVLRRMRELNYIDEPLYQDSILVEDDSELHNLSIEVEAPYVAEMVRQEMQDRFGKDIYTSGYKVYTTVKSDLQEQANKSLRMALMDYEHRHGYRGPEKRFQDFEMFDLDNMYEFFKTLPDDPFLEKAAVMTVEDDFAFVMLETGELIQLCWKQAEWAAPYTDGNQPGPSPTKISQVLTEGDVVRVYKDRTNKWALGQLPEVEGALVSLSSKDASVLAIVGGYDFYKSKFNRAAQAKRQPGSNLKPFIYSAALERGYTAATTINDAPVVFDDPGLEDTWRPENYSGKFFGPTRFREALVSSRNLVSIRILRSIGSKYAISYLSNFNFDQSQLPNDLSLALGSATLTPLEVATGYAVFANGGYRVEPYIVKRIEDVDGKVLFEANPLTVCEKCKEQDVRPNLPPPDMVETKEIPKSEEMEISELEGLESLIQDLYVDDEDSEKLQLQEEQLLTIQEPDFVEIVAGLDDFEPPQIANVAPRVLEPRNVYIMTSIMRDIIKRGTGRRALILKRGDIAGKTGTTNDQRDAWFSGFNPEVVTTAWVGFDKPHPLGDVESGARAALPMWIDYMRVALKDRDEKNMTQPPGLTTVRIDPESGLLAPAGFPDGIFEIFKEEDAPKQVAEIGHQVTKAGSENGEKKPVKDEPIELF